MPEELPIHFNFQEAHERVYPKWIESGALSATPDNRENKYVIMMPLPNVTGALHMGHAMDNIMQDMLIRWHRMLGENTLWMPGCDHAGIATQAVVEKRLFELEGKTRHDIGRENLVERIWQWKDEYEARIISQQQQMGCSCAWDLHRFTMDPVCARAVREAFFRLFRDGLIYRGNRLVNWDCHLQTAVSDDEIVRKKVKGHFWHLKYPVVDPADGEPTHIVVATTRPETMLGDTAVAVHPDPEGLLKNSIESIKDKIANGPAREKKEYQAELERLEKRFETHLPNLLKLKAMAEAGKKVLLPLMNREIPIILDEWAKPELGSGCVKITPAHDPNDHEVWKRHKEEIDIINILNPDGTYNENTGDYAGVNRDEVRKRVVADLETQGLLLEIEDRDIELGLSDRSKTPVEPYVSKQWFVNMGDIDGGITCAAEMDLEFKSSGLAQVALDCVSTEWKSPTGKNLTFYPDGDRYRGTFVNWLSEKRDWCISRQLWWGHQIPIWHGVLTNENAQQVIEIVGNHPDEAFGWVADEAGNLLALDKIEDTENMQLLVCIRSEEHQESIEKLLNEAGLERDPDVLDTWFSSALWPFSTLGWPNPETAEVGDGKKQLGAGEDRPDYLQYYYPGSCLVTARDIITLWVARMAIMGLYLRGDVPFTDCFIHANVQDGKGERMSKSKGNGIDPVDIINEYGVDAMRYVICDMQTGSQDIKLPVQAISPYTGNPVELATAKHGRTIFTYIDPENGKEFDVLGTLDELPKARVTSDRFDIGRSFCTKLWNASRFAFINLGAYTFNPLTKETLEREDLWILSRLNQTIAGVTKQLEQYNPSAAIGTAREFFWNDLCDWYLEIIKPRLNDGKNADAARGVLAWCLDQTLRLFHPFVPYITEILWEKLNQQAPERGLANPAEIEELLINANWPVVDQEWISVEKESEFELVQEFVRNVRDMRSRYNVSPAQPITAKLKAEGAVAERVNSYRDLICNLVNIESLEISADMVKPPLSATAVLGESEIYLEGLMDPEKERAKLLKQKENVLKDLKRSENKLQNPGFRDKAPQAVVEKEEGKVKEMRAELDIIERSLKELE